jgi:indolepyruvate ferredoxin oxidoreductase beta subunit
MLPAGLGGFIERTPALFRALDRLVNRGRRVPVGRIGGFLQLYCVSALKPTRRMSLRHKRETEHREAWLSRATEILPKNYDLAVEVLRARRLVKGYSDTHARGLSKFDRVMAKAPLLVARADGPMWMARLIAAALIDEPGEALDGVAKTIDTL